MDKSSILANSGSFGQAFRALIECTQLKKKSVSLASITRACGIKSRGYMTEVLQNKRNLSQEHLPKLVRILDLDLIEAEVFKTLHGLGRAKSANARHELNLKLRRARKALNMSYQMMPPELGNLFFAFKVFAAFGLFENTPTREQLVSFFGRALYWEVDCALALLQKHKLIVAKDKHFVLPESQIIFNTSPDGMSVKQFIKFSLLDSIGGLDTWFDNGDLSRFHSTILCVNKNDYQNYLKELRSRLIKDQSELANPRGDLLVHFNVNLYPVEANRQGIVP